jgi:hypothetical protein
VECTKCGASQVNIVKQHDVNYMEDYYMCIKCGMVYYKELLDIDKVKPIKKRGHGTSN